MLLDSLLFHSIEVVVPGCWLIRFVPVHIVKAMQFQAFFCEVKFEIGSACFASNMGHYCAFTKPESSEHLRRVHGCELLHEMLIGVEFAIQKGCRGIRKSISL